MGILRDPKDGKKSMKRVIGLVGFSSLVVCLFGGVFYGKSVSPDPNVVSAIEFITISCILGTSADRYLSKKSNDATNNQTNN